MSTNSPTSIGKLILVPSLITLAITVLRLVGELQHWPTSLFNPAAGGGGALIGISWLPPIFGIYFARKLIQADETPETSGGRVILFAILGILLLAGGAALTTLAGPNMETPVWALAGLVLIIAAGVVQLFAWRKNFKVLLAYALAARIPVAILMFFAIKGNWGTHYDVAPPNFPDISWLSKYLFIGFLPQMFLWIPVTLVIGSLAAGIMAAYMLRGRATRPATA